MTMMLKELIAEAIEREYPRRLKMSAPGPLLSIRIDGELYFFRGRPEFFSELGSARASTAQSAGSGGSGSP